MIEELKDVMELATGATVFINEILKLKKNNKKQDEEEAIISSKGDSVKIGSSGNYVKIGSSGDSVKIGSSGNLVKIGSSGNYVKIGSSGNYVKIGSSGNYVKIGSSGDSVKIGSSGNYVKIGSSGDSVKIGSSGNYVKIGSSGDLAKIGSNGDSIKISSNGDSVKIGSSGNYVKIGSSGDLAKIGSSGDYAVISAIGVYSTVTAKKGSWITLAEYDYYSNAYIPRYVKTEFVDGEKIKEDTEYVLYDGEFREVIRADEITSAIIHKKGNVYRVVNFGDDFDNKKVTYLVKTDDNIYSHGETLQEAKDSLIYKITNRDTSMYKDYTLETKVTFEEAVKMYRVITGACEGGTRNFVENVLKNKKKKYTVKEVIEETQGQYGNDRLKEFFGVN